MWHLSIAANYKLAFVSETPPEEVRKKGWHACTALPTSEAFKAADEQEIHSWAAARQVGL